MVATGDRRPDLDSSRTDWARVVKIIDFGIVKRQVNTCSNTAAPRRKGKAFLCSKTAPFFKRQTSAAAPGGGGAGTSNIWSTLSDGSANVLGTPEYMSPEMWKGVDADVGFASDMWAVAVCLFQVLSPRSSARVG